MGLEDSDLVKGGGDGGGGGGGGEDKTASSVSCSICLDVITDNGDRAWAKLQCSHQFHLDCIGSAFNVKGVMQCPNCRKIEKGQWLFASGCRPFSEFSMDDWTHDEDLYDYYSEMAFGLHWCPFGGLTRLSSSFDEGEFPTTAYHDFLGQHAIVAEQSTVSSSSHHCPYIAYIGPVHSTSNSNASIPHDLSFNNQWGGQSTTGEMPNSYAFPTHMDVHHRSPFPTASSRMGGADQPSIPSMTQRPARANADFPRSASYVHPVVIGQSSAARMPSSVGSSMIPPYPSSVARARDRAQALQAYFQQPSNNNSPAMRTPVVRRSNSHNRAGSTQVGPMSTTTSEQTRGGVYFFPTSGSSSSSARNFHEPEASMPNPFHHTWERDPSFTMSQVERDHHGWGPFHQTGNGSDNTVRPVPSFRPRAGTDRMPSSLSYHQHRS